MAVSAGLVELNYEGLGMSFDDGGLDLLAALELRNSLLIGAGESYGSRKAKLMLFVAGRGN